MICALMIGREGSTGFPGKNLSLILGRPMMAYPLIAAQQSRYVDRAYVSTDSQAIIDKAKEYDARIIERPAELCTNTALGEDAYVHGYHVIRDELAAEGETLELLVLLMCNAATISGELLDKGIEILRANPDYDSAVTVSVYNMWSPLRARRLDGDGLLQPFIPFEAFPDPSKLSCDRDSQGNAYFADMGTSIVRPRCLDEIEHGVLPQKWMGRRIAPIKNWGGCDVDYEWQLPGVEFWLKAHGFEHASVAGG